MTASARALLFAVSAAVSTAASGLPAHADPLDEIGLGAAASGMANARAALARGAEATHGNPAGVARIARPEVLAGWQYAHHRLELDGDRSSVADAHGVSLALAVPFEIGGVHVAAGLAFYKPDRLLAHLDLPPVGEAHFVRFENALHRMVVEPVAAVSFGRVAIGAGASLLVDARAGALAFDVRGPEADPEARASVDAAMPMRGAPLLGVWWRPARALELAATVRGALALDLALDLRMTANIPGLTPQDAITSLRSVGTYTPMRAALAAAVHPAEHLALTGEVAIERWSQLGSGVPDLLVALDPDEPGLATAAAPASFRNIVTSRLGVEWQTGSWRLRAGGAYLPSPVPAQTGVTRFADGARTLATLGTGLRIAPGRVLLQPIDIDLAFGWQHVQHQQSAFTSGGEIIQGNVTTTVRF